MHGSTSSTWIVRTDTMQVVIGRIGRAHGIRGDVSVDIRTDEPERRFAPGSSVLCAGRTLTVSSSRPHGGRLLVGFERIADRDAAEALRGELISADIDPDESPDDEDAYYDHQLVGLQVRDDSGTTLGQVSEVVHLPAQDLLAVQTDDGEVLVPFVQELVPEVDLDDGHLVVVDLPGLFDPGAAEVVGPEGS